MTRREKLLDTGKSLLIALLLVSAVFLLLKAMQIDVSRVTQRLGVLLGTESVESGTESSDTEFAASAASPCFILVTTEDGSHYAAKYDSANKQKLVSQFSSYLGEALGSADSPVLITEAEWRKALSGSGVFFDYLQPQPLGAMASWLGTELSGDAGEHSARRLYLGSYSNVMCLYYIDSANASIYRCSTALPSTTLEERIAELPIGSASFAFEKGESYSSIDPYFILSDETAQLRAVTASNPLKDGFPSQELLRLFGMNGRTTSEYTESDGSAVYVDGEKSLRVNVSGELSFSVAGGSGVRIPNRGELKTADCISLVNSIVSQSLGLYSKEATLGLSGVSNAGVSDGCTLYSSYYIDGIPVKLAGGANAVRAQISGGSVVRMDMVFRSYTYTGETLLPMPEKQACAIAASSGGEPLLCYEDRADGVFCEWFFN